jgi:hypothetical protein
MAVEARSARLGQALSRTNGERAGPWDTAHLPVVAVTAPTSSCEQATYVEVDGAEVIAEAGERGSYRTWRRALVADDPARPVARTAHRRRIRSGCLLDPDGRLQVRADGPELPSRRRRSLFLDRDGHLEPAVDE